MFRENRFRLAAAVYLHCIRKSSNFPGQEDICTVMVFRNFEHAAVVVLFNKEGCYLHDDRMYVVKQKFAISSGPTINQLTAFDEYILHCLRLYCARNGKFSKLNSSCLINRGY